VFQGLKISSCWMVSSTWFQQLNCQQHWCLLQPDVLQQLSCFLLTRFFPTTGCSSWIASGAEWLPAVGLFTVAWCFQPASWWMDCSSWKASWKHLIYICSWTPVVCILRTRLRLAPGLKHNPSPVLLPFMHKLHCTKSISLVTCHNVWGSNHYNLLPHIDISVSGLTWSLL